MYDIFKVIPHQRVVSEAEIFDLYQCGIFAADALQENIELVQLQPQAEYKPHYHKNSSAVIYIIAGDGLFQLAEKLIQYQSSMRINVPAGVLHGFKTNTPTLFLSIQSPPIINPKNGAIDLHYGESHE